MYKREQVLTGLVDAGVLKAETKAEIMGDDIDRWYEWLNAAMDRTKTKCVTPEENDYPQRLVNLPDRPSCIYFRGDISIANEEAAIAMVGSRRPTSYGILEAEQFSGNLASRKIVIVSGMAYGIDSKAHRGAMDAGGRTIAVLGGGVDICYPRTNMDIYFEMCENQLVLSEYEPEVQHISIHFPQRNRMISGLSDGVLLVEATLRSGTMITADRALEQGKSVYGIPGRVTDINSRGIRKLIKQGAVLVDDPLDIVQDLYENGIIRRKLETKESRKESRNSRRKKQSLTTEEEIMKKRLGYEPIHIDDLIRQNNMDISKTIHIMKSLEAKGAVKCIEKSYYILR